MTLLYLLITGGFSGCFGVPIRGYFVNAGGQPNGPHVTDGLRLLINRGQLNSDKLIWKECVPNWATAGTIAELSSLFPPHASSSLAVCSSTHTVFRSGFAKKCDSASFANKSTYGHCLPPSPWMYLLYAKCLIPSARFRVRALGRYCPYYHNIAKTETLCSLVEKAFQRSGRNSGCKASPCANFFNCKTIFRK